MDVDHYRALVRPLVAGRKVVITGGPLAGLTVMTTLRPATRGRTSAR